MRFLVPILFSFAGILAAADKPAFRTDAEGPAALKVERDGKPLKWFQPVDGEFPPAGSTHAISGELIRVNHLERRLQMRVDRNDSQDASVLDLPLDATMLPYGSIWYHGAPAALQDIPLGTHLHGLFYLAKPDDKSTLPETSWERKTPEWEFRRCFRIEDDFTFHARQQQLWKIESVDLKAAKLTATLMADGKPVGKGKPAVFDLLSSTRVFQGNGFADLQALQPGQNVMLNLTWATLYSPGRITRVWMDEASRTLATQAQLATHRDHVREHGFPAWIQAVDDRTQIVTLTLFGGIDPKLFDELTLIDEKPFGWPLSKPEDNPKAPKGTIAVARDSLMTYDPVNDRKGGNILDIKKGPLEPGSSGVQVKVKCDMLLEGYRPRRIVRFYPATWKVIALPQEEQFHGMNG
jgi:hypothetical protein